MPSFGTRVHLLCALFCLLAILLVDLIVVEYDNMYKGTKVMQKYFILLLLIAMNHMKAVVVFFPFVVLLFPHT